VHLVPVFRGRLVAFDVTAGKVRGRFIPWAVIDYRQNPYEAAALLADDWFGDAPLADLRIADVLSLDGPLGGWEMAIVYRAELAALPPGDRERTPHVYDEAQFDAIGAFDPVDLERWAAAPVTAPAIPSAPRAREGPPAIF
jgi:hypothetical protein